MIGYYKGLCKNTAGKPQPHDKFGEMKLHDTLYQGSFVNGQRSGYGCIRWQNGNIYYGQFRDNEACGVGVIIYYNNSVYFGDFKNSKRHGQGFEYENLNDLENFLKSEKEWPPLIYKGKELRWPGRLPTAENLKKLEPGKISTIDKKKKKYYADKEDYD